MSGSELDYQLLRHLANDPATSQRGLASSLGISVGKLNYCLHALVDKGWIKINNFRRSDNKLAYAYLLTPGGVKAKASLARAFLMRKEKDFETLQREIELLRSDLS